MQIYENNIKQIIAESSTVLIVDDVPENLQVLGNVLLTHGLDVGFAVNGMQALESIEFSKPDIVLLDIMMPGMDGYEVCKILKSKPETADIPIIFLTAKNQTEDLVQAFNIGAVDFVTKPFNPSELLARVFTHLEIKKSRDIIRLQNEELQLLNASKDKFFSIISHDLKGPFTGLLGLTGLILQEKASFDFEEVIDIIFKLDQSLKKQYSLIEDLLQWARIQTNRIEITQNRFNIKHLVNEVFMILKNNAEEKNINLVNKLEDDCFAFADRFMYQSAIHNLTSNAIKFSYQNSEIIASIEDKEDYYYLTISDCGIGIKPENISKIFKIDTHFTTLGTNNEKGTGLGLILVKEMVERNNGTVSVQSEVNKGTKFTVSIKKS